MARQRFTSRSATELRSHADDYALLVPSSSPQRRTGQATEEIGAANPFTDAYTPLGRGPATKAPATAAASSSVADPEAGGEGDGQTVADHLAYTAKKLLLSRFSLGVSSYLLAEISKQGFIEAEKERAGKASDRERVKGREAV